MIFVHDIFPMLNPSMVSYALISIFKSKPKEKGDPQKEKEQITLPLLRLKFKASSHYGNTFAIANSSGTLLKQRSLGLTCNQSATD